MSEVLNTPPAQMGMGVLGALWWGISLAIAVAIHRTDLRLASEDGDMKGRGWGRRLEVMRRAGNTLSLLKILCAAVFVATGGAMLLTILGILLLGERSADVTVVGQFYILSSFVAAFPTANFGMSLASLRLSLDATGLQGKERKTSMAKAKEKTDTFEMLSFIAWIIWLHLSFIWVITAAAVIFTMLT